MSMPALTPFAVDPATFALDLCDKEDYKFPPNFGHGLKWKDKGGRPCESFLEPGKFQNGKRIIYRCVSTYIGGSCFGAMHWYSELRAYGTSIRYLDTNEVVSMGGYGPEQEKIQWYLRGITIRAQRRITKVEHDLADELIGKIGEYTTRFNTAEDAMASSLKLFTGRFEPGWILLDEEDYTKVLAET